MVRALPGCERGPTPRADDEPAPSAPQVPSSAVATGGPVRHGPGPSTTRSTGRPCLAVVSLGHMPNGPGETGGNATGRRGRRALRALLRHAGFLLLLVLGTVVRALAVHAYVPAFFFADSAAYLDVAQSGEAGVHRTWGYSGLLAVLERLV